MYLLLSADDDDEFESRRRNAALPVAHASLKYVARFDGQAPEHRAVGPAGWQSDSSVDRQAVEARIDAKQSL